MFVRTIVTLALLALGAAPAAAQDITTVFSRHNAASTQTVDHSDWGKLLADFVHPGPDKVNRVDYRRFKSQGQDVMHAYLARLQATNVSALSRNEQLAFWANLYNATTVDVVLRHYPVDSIRDIKSGLFSKGPWGIKLITVEGVELSLDDIEHKILRPIWRDPRVHYAVNCASIGCPSLPRVPFTGAKLDGMLDVAARDYINHPRGFSAQNGLVRASQIYSWYAADFGGSAAGVLRHARRYAQRDLARQLGEVAAIASYHYDWRLNDTIMPVR
jgi:hypothetical protein